MKNKHSALSQMWKRGLCIAAAGALTAVMLPALPLSAAGDKPFIPRAGSIPVSEEKYSSDSPFNEDGTGTAGSQYFRIPAVVTLDNGDLLATADARWGTTSDGGGLDTIASVSSDGGYTWHYSFPFFFPDSDGYAGNKATTIIDPGTLVGPDGTIYCFADVNPTGCTTLYKNIGTGTGYVTVNDKRCLALTMDYQNVEKEPTDDDLETYPYYVDEFDKNGYAKIRKRADNSETGYGVDEWYNLYTIKDGKYMDTLKQKQVNNDSVEVQQNAFYKDSAFHVYSIGYIWVITSKDNGRTWEHPRNINDQIKRHSGENAILVSPGKGITTSSGDLVIGYYDHGGAGNEENASIGYSTDNGNTWKRTNDVPGTGAGGCWSSENEIVELEDGTLRMFFRSGTKHISYADAVKNPKTGEYTMSKPVITGESSFSGCNVTALSYSKKINGKQVILVACPTDASSRSKGKIFTYLVEDDNSMTLFSEFSVPQKKNNLFNYSCLTELEDGSIGLLWETSWNDIVYDHFSILDICPAANISGVTVDVELEEGETYTRTCSVKGNITEQPNTEIASLTTADGCIAITGIESGFTRTVIDGVMYRILVEKNAADITLDEGISQEFPNAVLSESPSASEVVSVEEYDESVTGIFDHTSNTPSSLDSFSDTVNSSIQLADAEFTFTGSGTSWQIKNDATNTYLTNTSSADIFFSSNAANMTVTPIEEKDAFRICKEDGKRFVIFYFNSMNFNSNSSYTANYADGSYEVELLEKHTDSSEGDILPGYRRASHITSGQKYLISYIWNDGSVFVLYPQNGQNNQTKLAYRAKKGVRVTAAAPGNAQVTIDGKVYTFTVTDQTCSHANVSLRNMVPVDCDMEGYTGDRVCDDCGYILSHGYTLAPLGHNWDEGKVTKEVSENENGEIHYTCRYNPFHTKTKTVYSHIEELY